MGRTSSRWVAVAVSLVVFALGCTSGSGGDTVWLRIQGSDQPLTAAKIVYEPNDAVRSARLGANGWLAIERQSRERPIAVAVPGFCPVTIPKGPQLAALKVPAIIDLGGDRPPLGFDAGVAIAVQHGCPERGRGQITWRQLAGAPLRELVTSEDGFMLRARTPSLAQLHPDPLPDGLVPFSPRSQGRALLEATWHGPGASQLVRTVAIPATSRSSGLSSVAVSQQLVLSDPHYRVKSAPQGGHAQPLMSGAVSLFTPDAPGRWVLERDGGRALTLQALWHDKTPYDCGRSECHAQIAADTIDSPMSHALERQLTGSDNHAAVGCMLDCHVVGERGLDDGGFLDVAGELGFTALDGLRWQDLPQALRRLGGVRCTACHGPGAIPEPDAREAIVRSDVCATCHDAPPRYVHVQQWQASRMARSDAEANTRAGACASCHTTSGFLASLGARSTRALQPSAAPTGIACAACHAPHASHRGARLLRGVSDPSHADAQATRPDAASALCLRCHAPANDAAQPSAAAGPLYLGVARVPAASGAGWEELRGNSAHAAVPRGCTGCHGARTRAEDLGLDHSFRVDMRSCASCHANASAEQLRSSQREIEAHTRALLSQLGAYCSTVERSAGAQPLHAQATGGSCAEQRFTRALYEVSLVLEDPAAGLHNAAFARELLRDAERQLVPVEK